MTSLHVICGLGPPQSKILATPMSPAPLSVALLANTRKSLKFYRFESAHVLVCLISLNFFCLFLVYFAAGAGNIFNLFLNFEQK